MIELDERHGATGSTAIVTGLKTARIRISPIYSGARGFTIESICGYRVETSRLWRGRERLATRRQQCFKSYQAAADYALGYAQRIAKQAQERDAQAGIEQPYSPIKGA